MTLSTLPQTKPKALIIGNAVLVRARLRNAANEVIDPEDLVLKVRGPAGGSPTSYDMVAMVDDPLMAEAAFLPNLPGTWYYRVESSSPAAAVERSITIVASDVES